MDQVYQKVVIIENIPTLMQAALKALPTKERDRYCPVAHASLLDGEDRKQWLVAIANTKHNPIA
ncbi:MAG: hypothetical protein KME52_09300 [Desmonostoc geniculatum HA4340-LM1]|nr:hypothetical protein [Desmonostoc geniculatum HA4340-LM1]